MSRFIIDTLREIYVYLWIINLKIKDTLSVFESGMSLFGVLAQKLKDTHPHTVRILAISTIQKIEAARGVNNE